jgi:hypothetical protein
MIMLLKWLLTLLSFLWLIQALRPYFQIQTPHKAPKTRIFPPEPDPKFQKPRFDQEDGEYVDYEEIK